jgi:hypothetical protein
MDLKRILVSTAPTKTQPGMDARADEFLAAHGNWASLRSSAAKPAVPSRRGRPSIPSRQGRPRL